MPSSRFPRPARLLPLFCLLALLAGAMPAAAEDGLACGHFAPPGAESTRPASRNDPHSWGRLHAILAGLRAAPHEVLFLGDSLTERWPLSLWQQHLGRRGALNAGINGDRTEHLLWRLQQGGLDAPPPRLAILLIGTNDLGHGRPAAVAAEGIRANLALLRARLPATRILLLGLLPRGFSPDDRFRPKLAEVNRLIAGCADGGGIVFADIGGALLDPSGRLTPAIAPDGLHFSAAGYAILGAALDPLLDRLLAANG